MGVFCTMDLISELLRTLFYTLYFPFYFSDGDAIIPVCTNRYSNIHSDQVQ
jgi:hypothetical protein